MKYFSVLLAILVTFFIGCGGGGGGSSSNASSDNIVKASGTQGVNGANYTLTGSVTVTWDLPIMDNSITLSNFKLTVEGVSYPINYTVSKNIPVDPNTQIAQPGSISIPFSFLATLPFSNKSRVGNLNIDYEIADNTKSVAIPVELASVSNSDDVTNNPSIITTIESSTKSTHNSQQLHYIGQIKKGNDAQSGVIVEYAVLTPTYIYDIPANGSLRTDKNGIFTLNLKSSANPLQESREIVVLFSSQAATSIWKITQEKSPTPSEFKIEKVFSQDNSGQDAVNLKYVGKLVSDDFGIANQSLSYEVIPSNAATEPKGSVRTDEFGNFNLNLALQQNTTGTNKDVNVIIKYKTASTTWHITQSSQNNQNEYSIEIPSNPTIFANGGEYRYVGFLKDKNNNQAVSGAQINYSILSPAYIASNADGTLTTDANGKFILTLIVKENISTSSRNIPIIFSYKNTVETLNITQNPAPSQSPYIFEKYFSQNNTIKQGGEISYFGKLTSKGMPLPNESINYTVSPTNSVNAGTNTGTITTDNNGNFNLSLNILENTSGLEKNIAVVFNYKDQSEVWEIKQSDAIPSRIETINSQSTVAAGSVAWYYGKLYQGSLPWANQTITYQVIPPFVTTPSNGSVVTDSDGNFILSLNINGSNISNTDTISVGLTHGTDTTLWSLTQIDSNLTITITTNPLLNVPNSGGVSTYEGTVQYNDGTPVANQNITYSALTNPSVLVSPLNGFIMTDASGNFSLNVNFTANTSGSQREIPIVFSYNTASKIIKIKQD